MEELRTSKERQLWCLEVEQKFGCSIEEENGVLPFFFFFFFFFWKSNFTCEELIYVTRFIRCVITNECLISSLTFHLSY
jgi:hypothetical protein